jgi:antitoxin PrlF
MNARLPLTQKVSTNASGERGGIGARRAMSLLKHAGDCVACAALIIDRIGGHLGRSLVECWRSGLVLTYNANALHQSVRTDKELAVAKTTEILEIPATITDRGQTTVPAAIRKMLALGKRDQVVFRGLADGTVVIAKKQPVADESDPVIVTFLEFLARDMANEPAWIRPVPRSLVARGQGVVKGVKVDLDAALPDDEA